MQIETPRLEKRGRFGLLPHADVAACVRLAKKTEATKALDELLERLGLRGSGIKVCCARRDRTSTLRGNI